VKLQFGASLIDDASSVSYDHNMFIILVTGCWFLLNVYKEHYSYEFMNMIEQVSIIEEMAWIKSSFLLKMQV
jgi:hypothetical protein